MPTTRVAAAPSLSDAEILARCPLFAGLTDEDLRALATTARRRKLAAGEALFFVGETAKGVGVVVRTAAPTPPAPKRPRTANYSGSTKRASKESFAHDPRSRST